MNATDLFEAAMEYLGRECTRYKFFTERDIAWTIQLIMNNIIENNNLPYRIFHEYPILRPQGVRATCTDLAILNEELSEPAEVAIELKYEPAHERGIANKGDIWHTKFGPNVVFWKSNSPTDAAVVKDITRVHEYIEKKKALAAYAVLIDEGGYFEKKYPDSYLRNDPLFKDSAWDNWKPDGIQPSKIEVLWTRVQSSNL